MLPSLNKVIIIIIIILLLLLLYNDIRKHDVNTT